MFFFFYFGSIEHKIKPKEMMHLNSINHPHTFFKVQHYYFLATIIMVLLSILSYALGAIFVQSVTAAPEIFITLAVVLLYYHIPHFLFGIGCLIYYFRKVRSVVQKSKVYQTVIGILISPISIVVCYIGILLLGLSSCAG